MKEGCTLIVPQATAAEKHALQNVHYVVVAPRNSNGSSGKEESGPLELTGVCFLMSATAIAFGSI